MAAATTKLNGLGLLLSSSLRAGGPPSLASALLLSPSAQIQQRRGYARRKVVAPRFNKFETPPSAVPELPWTLDGKKKAVEKMKEIGFNEVQLEEASKHIDNLMKKDADPHHPHYSFNQRAAHNIPHLIWHSPNDYASFIEGFRPAITTELDERIIQDKRVVKVTPQGKKGKRFVIAVVGNRNGVAGYGVGKAETAAEARTKAIFQAKRNMVPIDKFYNTLHYDVHTKHKKTILKLRTAPHGFGLRCAEVVGHICEVAGIHNVGADVIGSTNPLNVTIATFKALTGQRHPYVIARARGKSLVDVTKMGPPRLLFYDDQGANKRDALSRKQIKEITDKWFLSFPREIKAEHFLLARQIHETLLSASPSSTSDLVKKNPDLVAWLNALPPQADLSFSLLYPHDFHLPQDHFDPAVKAPIPPMTLFKPEIRHDSLE